MKCDHWSLKAETTKTGQNMLLVFWPVFITFNGQDDLILCNTRDHRSVILSLRIAKAESSNPPPAMMKAHP
jgi:hypothetical protein